MPPFASMDGRLVPVPLLARCSAAKRQLNKQPI
jgi:hypothetical protein